MDKLDLPTFTSDFKKWKMWLANECVDEWEQFMEEGVQMYLSPDSSSHPWMMTELIDMMEQIGTREKNNDYEQTDLLQMEVDTPEVRR